MQNSIIELSLSDTLDDIRYFCTYRIRYSLFLLLVSSLILEDKSEERDGFRFTGNPQE